MIKRAAVDAVNAQAPCDIIEGQVLKDNPLQVQINSKLIVSGKQILKSAAVSKEKLAVGDKLLVIRSAGGQKYYLIDKVE